MLTNWQSTFTNLTNTIDQKTTTANHPGVITQLTNVVNKGISKVDEFVNADVSFLTETEC
jgi:hypothetical protein